MPLAHAILAFVEMHPMTGYDLKKVFDESVRHFWSATQSHIYKALNELEENGWVTVTLIPQEGKPNRKEYQITEAGREELHRWLITPLPLEQVRADWLIQIFFSMDSSNEQIIGLLQARLAKIRERQEIYRTSAQTSIDRYGKKLGDARSQQLWQITLDYGLDSYEFEIAWINKTLESLKHLPPLPLQKQ